MMTFQAQRKPHEQKCSNRLSGKPTFSKSAHGATAGARLLQAISPGPWSPLVKSLTKSAHRATAGSQLPTKVLTAPQRESIPD